MLSTRLSWPLFSSGSKTQATNYRLICYVFDTVSQPTLSIQCISAPLYPFSPQTRLGAMSRSGAWRPKKLTYCTSIRQREHKYCCQLYFEARFTSIASLLGVLTQPFYLLSKPDSPEKVCKITAFFSIMQIYFDFFPNYRLTARNMGSMEGRIT